MICRNINNEGSIEILNKKKVTTASFLSQFRRMKTIQFNKNPNIAIPNTGIYTNTSPTAAVPPPKPLLVRRPITIISRTIVKTDINTEQQKVIFAGNKLLHFQDETRV
jgi:hypothetical protein